MAKPSRPRRFLRRPSVEGLESRRLLAAFVVNSTADTLNPPAGTVTLRSAITAANAAAGPDTITFSLPNGSTISPGSPLPTITQAVTIDGTSGGKPGIVLSGTAAGAGTNGLTLSAAGVTIKGMAIGSFSGAGIEILGPGGDTVAGCYVGANAAGTAAAPNHVAGIFVFNSPNNTIGGSGANLNLISGNTGTGVDLAGTASKNNVVSFNLIGTNVTGNAALANNIGVSSELGSGNLLSNDLISGNTAGGISLQSGSNNVVRANLVGTNAAGTGAIANGSFGINVQGETNTSIGVGGFGLANVVSGNNGPGIVINGSTGTVVANAIVGMNKNATGALGNAADGILIENASVGTTIGGATGALGCFISGNTNNGIDVQSLSTGTVIQLDHIGSDVTGLIGIGNGQNGIQFQQTSGKVTLSTILDNGQSGVLLNGGSGSLLTSNTIGDPATGQHGNALNGVFVFGSNNNTIGGPSAGNVISSNANYGVAIESGSQNNLVAGNFIGLDSGGNGGRGNANGVAVFDSTGTTIGATAANGGNIIASNTNYGVDVHGTDSNGTLVLGNLIGLPATGSGTAPNASGIILDTTAGVVVQQNIISGNHSDGIFVNGGFSSLIRQNLIGTDISGFAGRGNGGNGIDIVGAANITVGGSTSSVTNVIAANGGYGIQVSGAGVTGTVITENLIGVNLGGRTALGNGQSGIWINNVPGTTIGGSPQTANVVANNGAQGILITGSAATNTSIVNNYVGLGADGLTVGANALDGILIQGTPGVNIAYNLISGNANYGVHLAAGTTGATLAGNLIGTDIFGAGAKPNGLAGVVIDNASGNIIGGTAGSATRNVISGNALYGVFIAGASATANTVEGNFIGVNSSGATALANGVDGVLVQGPGNTIGGTAAGVRNVISGNASAGVHLSGGSSNTLVAGNLIGTDLNGVIAVGNGFFGVNVDGTGTGATTHDTIGGSTAGARNVISGSGVVNLNVGGPLATGTLIAGNMIGTNLAGTVGLFATPYGIIINGAPTNTVGGTTAGLGNTISGSISAGLEIINTGASGNLVQGNLIGRVPGSSASLANNVGVVINNAPNNTVGGAAAGAANTITGNTTNTIQVTGAGATGNQTSGNIIGP
jgi:CSLREA domain-containing protein